MPCFVSAKIENCFGLNAICEKIMFENLYFCFKYIGYVY